MFPKDDPQVVIYAAVGKLQNASALPKAIRGLITDTGTYLGVEKSEEKESVSQIKMPNYTNKNVDSSKEYLESQKIKTIVIGNGERIIKQYPDYNSTVTQNDKVFLLTNGKDYIMPNMKSWSRSDVEIFFSLINMKVRFNNYGYVTETSIKSGEKLDVKKTVEVTLEPKYSKLEEEIKEENKKQP
jgi:beta-lactam-binding protein with PASTA domain